MADAQPCQVCLDTGEAIRVLPSRSRDWRGTRLGYSACKAWMYVFELCSKCRGKSCAGPRPREVEDWASAAGFRWPDIQPSPERGVVVGWVTMACDEVSGEIEIDAPISIELPGSSC